MLRGDGQAVTALEIGELLAAFLQAAEGLVPTLLQRSGHQAIGRIDLLVTPLGKLGLILGALQPHPPLPLQGIVTLLQLLEHVQGKMELIGVDDLQDALRRPPGPPGRHGIVMHDLRDRPCRLRQLHS